ncbi:MAG: heavy metal translocating P-type ATPase [Pseudomonadota bacterium]
MSQTITLSIDKMHCGSCVGRVDRALAAVPGVDAVSVNLATETAVITGQGKKLASALMRASEAAGYPARVAKEADFDKQETRDAEARVLWRNTLLAMVLALPVFVVEMGGHLLPAFHHWLHATFGEVPVWWFQAGLTTLALTGPGRSFYEDGFPALLRGAPDMNSLVAVGTSAAYLYSLAVLIMPDVFPVAARAVYFEAAVVIVVLVLLGRWLEARAKGKTGAAIHALIRLQPKTAQVSRGGQVQSVSVESLALGDLIMLRPGERVPTDGDVVEGRSLVDESMINGEPIPVEKFPGAPVTGGTVNGSGSLQFRVTRVGQDTVLAGILRMVREAQGAKLPIQAMVDRVTLWFVPAVLGIAALTVLAWIILGPAPVMSYALVAGVSVLIIACPCAMGLATPTSIMVATGRAAELGVLFRKGDALQTLAEVDVVAFDKTGTLTEGLPHLVDLQTSEGWTRDDVLRIVASIEARGEHPLGAAIVTASNEARITLCEAQDVAARSGFGIAGTVQGHTVVIGSDRLMASENVDISQFREPASNAMQRGETVFFASIDGSPAACMIVADTIKPQAAALVAHLRSEGIEVALITGDRPETAAHIAKSIGIETVAAGVLPAEKAREIAGLQSSDRTVAFVGDGINDGPALAAADVGIAIGTGTDVAIQSADVVLMSGDLKGIGTALQISRSTLRNILQNLFWAFGYNTALIPVAAGVFYAPLGLLLSPVLAAGAMALSSVFVLTNALRLRKIEPALD